ncbi:Glycosyl transferase, family 2 [Trichormus variabilis ATCC 29413]|uniref:Glycosyl transferase, family 2 n=3 Tax=Anabaena variabilis TaxID=264691 RepID=Q3M3J9_TRIV2|nr:MULTISPECIES: glycosyltransferase family 2 protein [Nostocaceae]ABA24437.1 Glycosyl transferase, family 2 [Trichormus variabilis ATCC 29413]
MYQEDIYMKPDISVIIPAYNTEAYIAKAIESVLFQTWRNFELIVVDDASTDCTVDVIKSFTDQRIKLFVNPKNTGASGARNRALQIAQGKWIAVLDADDWYAPERLEKLWQVATSENADIVADDFYIVQDGEHFPRSTAIRESGEKINDLKIIEPVFFVKTDVYGKRGLRLGLSKPMFKREFLIKNNIKYDETLTVVQDFWLDMECLVRGAKFILIPQPYYYYRCREGSLITSSHNHKKNLEQSCQKIVDFIKQENLYNQNPELAQALSYNLQIFEKNLAYYRVIEPIKQKYWLQAVRELINYPYVLIHLLLKIPGIIKRRIQYYLFKDKSAFKIYN